MKSVNGPNVSVIFEMFPRKGRKLQMEKHFERSKVILNYIHREFVSQKLLARCSKRGIILKMEGTYPP